MSWLKKLFGGEKSPAKSPEDLGKELSEIKARIDGIPQPEKELELIIHALVRSLALELEELNTQQKFEEISKEIDQVAGKVGEGHEWIQLLRKMQDIAKAKLGIS